MVTKALAHWFALVSQHTRAPLISPESAMIDHAQGNRREGTPWFFCEISKLLCHC